MNDSSATSRQHYLFALLLFMAGLLIILIFLTVRSQADTSNTEIGVTNAVPTIDSIVFSTTTTGVATTTIRSVDSSTSGPYYIHGSFTDNNGCTEVTGADVGIKAAFYAPDASNVVPGDCTADSRDCFVADTATCTISNCTGSDDPSADFVCPMVATSSFYYYATAGDWTASVIVIDNQDATSSESTVTSTVSSLTAIDLSGALNWGNMPLASTSHDLTLTAANTGNQTTDLYIKSTQMTCTIAGFIATSSIHWDNDSGVAYGSMTPATDTVGGVQDNINLVRRTTGAPSTDDISLKVQTPESGVAGTCTGVVTVNAG